MAFITKNNGRNLEFQTTRDLVERIAIDELYKLSLWMLTKREQQWLAAARMFYENPEFFIEHFYVKIKKPDRRGSNLVYPPGPPAYHAAHDCKALISDYINYEIPVEITNKGEEVKAEFRAWWKENNHLLQEKPELFRTKMETRWLLKNPPSLKSIEAVNSGVDRVENPDVTEVEARIDERISSMRSTRNQHKSVIDTYGKRTFMIEKGLISISNLDNLRVLKKWSKEKQLLKNDMRLYFRLRFNPELELDGTLLETIGFKACAHCHKNQLSI